jgi:hypothetical protein
LARLPLIITYNHQSYVGNANFENAWIRNSAAEGYEASLSVSINDLEYKWCELLSADNQQAVTRTYLYKIIGYHNSTLQNYTPNPNANYNWWGIPPYSGNVKCPYTLRVSGAITNTQQVEEESAGILKIYPVPTSDAVTIEFALEEATDVILNVFDLNGRLIKTVLTGKQTKGKHNVNLSLDEFSSGVYFCRLQAGSEVFTQKIVKIN